MLLEKQWESIAKWFERLPWWIKFTGVAPFLPLAAPLIAFCICPRIVTIGCAAIAIVYGWLLWEGIVTWAEIGEKLVAPYLFFLTFSYLGLLEHLLKRAYDRFFPSNREQEAKTSTARDDR